MRLGSVGILEEKLKGNIFIEPFRDESVQPNSYDVAIDKWFYSLDDILASFKGHGIQELVVQPGHESIETLWIGPKNAEDSDGFVVIQPNSMVLAVTQEVIGAYNEFTTLMKTKSTIARLGIEVCAGAGFGDIGFVNKWTLEIRNNTRRRVLIPVGTKIAQMAFDRIEGQGVIYHGSYVQTDNWSPDKMLPVVKPSIMVT